MSQMRMQYRIGEFAELGGVSTKTLRHYDKVGLLRPAFVDARTRYRCYTAVQLRELSSILALRELGLSLPEIRVFLSRAASPTDRRALLLRLRQSAQDMMAKAVHALGSVDAALAENIDQPGVLAHCVPIVMKRRRGMRIASLRAELETYVETEVLRVERELFSALPPESLGTTRGVMWQRCARSGSLLAEPFVEIKHDVARRSFYDLKDLPPVTAACAFSSDNEMAAERTFRAINTWMSARGYFLDGPKREIYLDGMLEIQFPLQSKPGKWWAV